MLAKQMWTQDCSTTNEDIQKMKRVKTKLLVELKKKEQKRYSKVPVCVSLNFIW